MTEYFSQNMHTAWFALGFLLLAIEALALGFSTGFVLFSGLAALLTGGLIWGGVLPATWLAGIASFAVCSVLITAALWKPLKRLQSEDKTPARDTTSDWIGQEFRLEQDISFTQPGKRQYSGIQWRVEVDDSAGVQEIAAGTKVVVASLDVGVFRVKPAAVE